MEKLFSCGAILFRRENGTAIYLLLDHKTHWDFPKGHKEQGESEEETILREVKEETGIKDVKLKDFKKKISWMFKRNGKLVSKEAVYYLAETKEKDVQISWEHVGFKWCLFEEALALIKFKNSKELLEEANLFVEKNL